MRIKEAELVQREINRAMILAGKCPNCGGKLRDASERFIKTSPKYHWRECLKCATVMGVSK